MQDKNVLVVGARNKWSISWHCALSLMREGARVAFSVYSDREKADVEKLLRYTNAPDSAIFLCNATLKEDIDKLYEQVSVHFDGKLDALLHGIAFAKRDELTGEFAT